MKSSGTVNSDVRANSTTVQRDVNVQDNVKGKKGFRIKAEREALETVQVDWIKNKIGGIISESN
ncbi:hypothetical protein ACT7DE_18960 [Bacillus paranthracis]